MRHSLTNQSIRKRNQTTITIKPAQPKTKIVSLLTFLPSSQVSNPNQIMPSPDVKQEDEQSHIEENQSTTHNPPPPPPLDEEVEVEVEAEVEDEDEEEGDDYDDDEEDEDEDDDEEEEEDLNFDSPSSTSIPKVSILEQTPQPPLLIDQKLFQITPITPPTTTTTPIEEKKPPPPMIVSDESRKLFQRLWTDEDEIGLLQGYLDFTIQRGGYHNSSYHHDTGPFYDQIKTRLQLDFNKNQLVEKLRRLKKKYRNVVTRATSGKDVSFKTPHDQATYEIARKIWGDGISSSRSVAAAAAGGGGGKVTNEEVGIAADDELNSNNVINSDVKPNIVNVVEKKVSATPSRRSSQKRAAEAELPNMPKFRKDSSTTNAIEDTVRSCLSPLFKELINCATNGPCNLGGGLGGVALNPMPINFGGNSLVNFGNGEKLDERWRKQQILELEVYSKRIELVQDQIKSTLEDLRSMDK